MLEKTVFVCEFSGRYYANAQDAMHSETLGPRVRMWSKSVQERVSLSTQAAAARFTEFLTKIYEDNSTPMGITVVATPPTGLALFPVEGSNSNELTSIILDLCAAYAVEAAGGGFVIPIVAADNILLELTEYYGKTGVYKEKEPDEQV